MPKDESQRETLFRPAASHGSDGIKELELLFRYGVDDLNWREGPEHGPVYMPILGEDKVPYRTPLPVAALCGHADVVEWLISHGAEAAPDYDGMDPKISRKARGIGTSLRFLRMFPGVGQRSLGRYTLYCRFRIQLAPGWKEVFFESAISRRLCTSLCTS